MVPQTKSPIPTLSFISALHRAKEWKKILLKAAHLHPSQNDHTTSLVAQSAFNVIEERRKCFKRNSTFFFKNITEGGLCFCPRWRKRNHVYLSVRNNKKNRQNIWSNGFHNVGCYWKRTEIPERWGTNEVSPVVVSVYFLKRDPRPRYKERDCKESLVVCLSWGDLTERLRQLEFPEQNTGEERDA